MINKDQKLLMEIYSEMAGQTTAAIVTENDDVIFFGSHEDCVNFLKQNTVRVDKHKDNFNTQLKDASWVDMVYAEKDSSTGLIKLGRFASYVY